MKKEFGNIVYTRLMRVISTILIAVSGTALACLLGMLFLVRIGGYRGMSHDQMINTAMDRISANNMIYLMNELTSSHGVDWGENEGIKDATSQSYRNYCREVSEEYGKMRNVRFAVILSDKERFDDLDLTDERIYLYKSPGYTGYTGVITGESFVSRYYTEDRPYIFLLEDNYTDWGKHEFREESDREPNYIYVLYTTADTLSADGYDRFDKMYTDSDLRGFLEDLHWVDKNGIPLVIVSLLVMLASLLTMCVSAGHKSGKEEVLLSWIDKIPLELITVAVVAVEIFLVVMLIAGIKEISYLRSNSFGYQDMMILCWAGSLLGMLLGAVLLGTCIARVKAKSLWRTTIIGSIFSLIARYVRRVADWTADNVPLAARVCIVLPPVGIISIVEAALIEDASRFIALLFVFGRFLVIILALYLVWGYSKLCEGVKRIAAGELDEPIDKRYLTPEYRKFAGKLNSVGESIQIAVEERMKSERLKTQLITNVSHDIKTPLTSIISYVDLLQKDDVPKEDKKEYLAVLSKQSDRLKKLIQDLIDASKASSGAVEVELAETDLNTLARQVLGEYQDKFEAAGLTAVSKISEEKITVNADSNLLWRVMDNLYTNVLKYAMPGTRVYVETSDHDGKNVFAISNISKAELGVSEDELMERFVRGDASRNTEGSGLGLSIARSLMELMGGSLSIKVDGDMFKAILELK